ncbi:hypothetical protein PROFUN_03384 [Planoprotostelium fungivorum]|uniref:Uncharacterized protein n=1 Tax=Planoprotostelium fungivorum TaxID=1890364 RepID=A0A2P6NWD7_9EUKA|nr:hypothetical protein PROFUN_03384 [Planoprotostelium fungivorum]
MLQTSRNVQQTSVDIFTKLSSGWSQIGCNAYCTFHCSNQLVTLTTTPADTQRCEVQTMALQSKTSSSSVRAERFTEAGHYRRHKCCVNNPSWCNGNIARFHRAAPGSTPGDGTFVFADALAERNVYQFCM